MGMVSPTMTMPPSIGARGHWLVWWVRTWWCQSYVTTLALSFGFKCTAKDVVGEEMPTQYSQPRLNYHQANLWFLVLWFTFFKYDECSSINVETLPLLVTFLWLPICNFLKLLDRARLQKQEDFELWFLKPRINTEATFPGAAEKAQSADEDWLIRLKAPEQVSKWTWTSFKLTLTRGLKVLRTMDTMNPHLPIKLCWSRQHFWISTQNLFVDATCASHNLL